MTQKALLTVSLLLIATTAFAEVSNRTAGRPGRRLVLCLDGVGYDDFSRARARGAFAYMKPPSRVIAPFPSLTNPSMVQILKPEGSPLTPGYEDRYYCVSDDRMKGGLLDRLRPSFVQDSFRGEFDFHPPGALSIFEYAIPPLSCALFTRLDLWRGGRRFEKSSGDVFLAYIGPTDCAAHTGGQGVVQRLLRHIDGKLRELLRKDPGLEIVLFSDHGNAYGKYRRVDPGKLLARAGYRVGSQISSRMSVVIPKYGLIGAAVVHCDPLEAAAVAGILAQARGVQFAVFKSGGTVRLLSEGGAARIEAVDDRLCYLPGSANPLDLKAACRTPAEWLWTTQDHHYPDAVNRVWERSGDVVVNQATVLVGFQPGYYAGSKVLDLFVALRATHGGLDAKQSVGFAASTGRTFPRFLTSAGAWEHLR